MSPLRIALVITELEVGGAEQCLVRLATGLDRGRFEPVVYSLAPWPPAGRDQLVRSLVDAAVEVHSLEARGVRHFLPALRRLTGFLRQQRPHLVQSFLFHANVLGQLAARRANVRHAIMGIRVADPTWWRGLVERLLTRRASGVVCVSQGVADYCREQHKLTASKLVVIPNGIDADALARIQPAELSALGVLPGRKALTFIGRLERQKDPGWLIAVARVMLPKLPQHDLVVVGEGAERKRLESAARSLSIADRVHFAGWRPDALAILAASQVLLLTSRHEGMPNVVLEAMALGKPVVATRAEGVMELLGAAADEQTAAWGDTESFAARIVSLANDPAACNRLGRVNQARVTEYFSLPAMVAAYEKLYSGLAAV